MKQIVTYLNFDGDCAAAVGFYAKCLDAELTTMPFAAAPGDDMPEAIKNRVMHACISKGGTSLIMASDTMPGHNFEPGNNFSVSIQCESPVEIDKLFAAVGEGGTVKVPLHDAFWGARFGMLLDQFGVNWMFNYEYPKG